MADGRMICEPAHAAGHDPVAFRLAHLQDARARAVVTSAAERFGWSRHPRGGGGEWQRYRPRPLQEPGRLLRHLGVGAICAWLFQP
jgi:hypothetical protein